MSLLHIPISYRRRKRKRKTCFCIYHWCVVVIFSVSLKRKKVQVQFYVHVNAKLFIHAFMHLILVQVWLFLVLKKRVSQYFFCNSCGMLILVRIIPVKINRSLTGIIRTCIFIIIRENSKKGLLLRVLLSEPQLGLTRNNEAKINWNKMDAKIKHIITKAMVQTSTRQNVWFFRSFSGIQMNRFCVGKSLA